MKISNETKVGILITLAIILFIWGFSYLKGSPLFVKTQEFYAVYEKIDGIARGNPVLISGYTVGKVEKIEFSSEGRNTKIVLKISIKKDIAIPSNSIARIHSSDILGSKAVELILGDAVSYAGQHDTLYSDIEVGLSESINKVLMPVKERAENLITSVDSVVTALEAIIKAVDIEKIYLSIESTIASLERISNSMDDMVRVEVPRIHRIIANVEDITITLKDNKENINNIVSNFSSVSDTLASIELFNILNKTEKTLTELSDIVEKINQGEGTIGLLVNDQELYRNLESTSKSLDELMNEMKKNPFKYFNISLFNFSGGGGQK